MAVRGVVGCAVLVAVLGVGITACSSGPQTKEEFLSQAFEAKPPKDDADRAFLEKYYSCTWDKISDDRAMVDEFMSTVRGESSRSPLREKVSAKMAECLKESAAPRLPTGSSGTSGATGSTGSGATGATGSTGSTGSGATGATGSTGSGASAAATSTGATGVTGTT